MVTILLLWTLCNELVTGLTITYEEVQKLGLSCYPKDSCKEPRSKDSPGVSDSYSCSCDRLCSEFGTCCVDSPFRSVKPSRIRPSCRNVNLNHNRSSYFMVDRCANDGNHESTFEKLCDEEWSGEDDLMKLVPVTSLLTSMTYKNYFCFRCHETTTNDFSYWSIRLTTRSSPNMQPGLNHIRYNNDKKSWTINYSNLSIPVNLMFRIPPDIWSLPVECLPGIISDCSPNWHDSSIRDKCQDYTGIVIVRKKRKILKYKNTHCALCNFESVKKMACKTNSSSKYREEAVVGRHSKIGDRFQHGPNLKVLDRKEAEKKKVKFSFVHLMDINPSGGDKVGKKEKCKENFLWDDFSNVCRKLSCALPGYVIKNWKCVPP